MSDPVLELLQKNNISFTVSGKDYLIKCLNPDHEDNNPSLRVDKQTGIAHCFSCGWKRNLFKHFNINVNIVPIKVLKLKEKLKELIVQNANLSMPEDYVPFTTQIRGISVHTLKHFEAFYTWKQELKDRIVFPIRDVMGNIVVFVGRHVSSDVEPRYKNYPRGYTIPCYPLKFEQQYTSAILVEGIFDMLNLYDKGIKNVVCCFGTNTLKNSVNTKLLPLKAQGIHKLYIMFDGDNPGKEAATELKPALELAGYTTEIINLPDDTDPGDLSQEWVDKIKEYINAN